MFAEAISAEQAALQKQLASPAPTPGQQASGLQPVFEIAELSPGVQPTFASPATGAAAPATVTVRPTVPGFAALLQASSGKYGAGRGNFAELFEKIKLLSGNEKVNATLKFDEATLGGCLGLFPAAVGMITSAKDWCHTPVGVVGSLDLDWKLFKVNYATLLSTGEAFLRTADSGNSMFYLIYGIIAMVFGEPKLGMLLNMKARWSAAKKSKMEAVVKMLAAESGQSEGTVATMIKAVIVTASVPIKDSGEGSELAASTSITGDGRRVIHRAGKVLSIGFMKANETSGMASPVATVLTNAGIIRGEISSWPIAWTLLPIRTTAGFQEEILNKAWYQVGSYELDGEIDLCKLYSFMEDITFALGKRGAYTRGRKGAAVPADKFKDLNALMAMTTKDGGMDIAALADYAAKRNWNFSRD